MLAESLILLVTVTCLLSSPIWFFSAFIPNISNFPDSHPPLSWWPCLPSHRENSDINMPSIKFMSITHFIFPTAFLVQNAWLSDFTFTFHFHASEKEMAIHSSVLTWRIPGTGEPGGVPSMGSHDWSDLAAAAAGALRARLGQVVSLKHQLS